MPARKKKKRPSVPIVKKDSFEKDDLIFARVTGHPPWPALVGSVDEAQPVSYVVLFFGTMEMAILHANNLLPYEENLENFRVPAKKLGPKRTALFNKSLADCNEFKDGGNEGYFDKSFSKQDEQLSSDLDEPEPTDLDKSVEKKSVEDENGSFNKLITREMQISGTTSNEVARSISVSSCSSDQSTLSAKSRQSLASKSHKQELSVINSNLNSNKQRATIDKYKNQEKKAGCR